VTTYNAETAKHAELNGFPRVQRVLRDALPMWRRASALRGRGMAQP
jgi:hypothetical protein